MKYSIVVPCYNESGNIYALVSEFIEVNEALKKDGFELILVDNGSKDTTGAEIDKCVDDFGFIHKVTVKENQGYGYGILQGMLASEGKYIGWIHADLQFSPALFIEIARQVETEERTGVDNLYFKGLRKGRPFLDCVFTFGMSCFETIYLQKGLWDINAQPTLMSRQLFEKAKNPPYGFSLDLYFYYNAKEQKYVIKRFQSLQKAREIGTSTWNTGMSARIKLIKRNLKDSKEMKKKSK